MVNTTITYTRNHKNNLYNFEIVNEGHVTAYVERDKNEIVCNSFSDFMDFVSMALSDRKETTEKRYSKGETRIKMYNVSSEENHLVELIVRHILSYEKTYVSAFNVTIIDKYE